MGYRLVRLLSRLLLGLFYRRHGVGPREAIPSEGALVVAANHHASLIDPMLLLAEIDRPLRPLAKAPLFAHPVIRPFLAALGALPVYRAQDRHLVQGSNRGLFTACIEALGRGEGILIFPEGLSKAAPLLSELKPGAARMALEAEAAAGWSLGLRLLPIGIHLDEAGRFRRGRVFGLVGPTLAAAEHRASFERDPDRAVRELSDRLAEAIRGLIVEVESTEELKLLRIAVQAWARERGERLDDAEEARVARRFAAGYRQALREAPEAARKLRHAVEGYARSLEHFRLSGAEVDTRYTAGRVASYLLRRGGALVLGAPLGLLGAALNAAPYRLVGIVAGRLSDGEDVWASVKIGAALVLFPLCWMLEAGAAAALEGPLAGLATLLGAPLLGLWALRFRDRAASFGRELRAFLLLAGGGGLAAHLRAARRGVHAEVESLRARLEATGRAASAVEARQGENP